MLIRIPMPSEVEEVVTWSDISLNSELSVLRLLNEAAESQGKIHKVILMVDLGDLREGFWDWDELVDAALEVEHHLPNLELLGVGTNLGCYGSIQPPRRRCTTWWPPRSRWRRPSAGSWRSSPAARPLPSIWCWTAPCRPASTTCGGGGNPAGQHLGLQYGLYA